MSLQNVCRSAAAVKPNKSEEERRCNSGFSRHHLSAENQEFSGWSLAAASVCLRKVKRTHGWNGSHTRRPRASLGTSSWLHAVNSLRNLASSVKSSAPGGTFFVWSDHHPAPLETTDSVDRSGAERTGGWINQSICNNKVACKRKVSRSLYSFFSISLVWLF